MCTVDIVSLSNSLRKRNSVKRELLSEQVMKKMKLLIWVLITLCNYSCYAATNKVIENVYIDTLIQRYLSEEKELWETIYSNGSDDRSHNNVNFILNKIRISHDDIFQDRYLEYVMSVAYMSKFIKYVDFYNIQNYAEGYQHHILSSIKPQPESFMTLDMTFNVYNYTRADQLFREIDEVSLRKSI